VFWRGFSFPVLKLNSSGKAKYYNGRCTLPTAGRALNAIEYLKVLGLHGRASPLPALLSGAPVEVRISGIVEYSMPCLHPGLANVPFFEPGYCHTLVLGLLPAPFKFV